MESRTSFNWRVLRKLVEFGKPAVLPYRQNYAVFDDDPIVLSRGGLEFLRKDRNGSFYIHNRACGSCRERTAEVDCCCGCCTLVCKACEKRHVFKLKKGSG